MYTACAQPGSLHSSQVSATTEKMNNNITISSQIIKTDVDASFDQLPPTQNDNPSLAEIIDCLQRQEIVVNQIITVVDRLIIQII
jgi:hypothetical protein